MTRSVWAWVRVLGGAIIIALLAWRLGTGAFLDGLRVIDGGTLLLAFGIGVTTTSGTPSGKRRFKSAARKLDTAVTRAAWRNTGAATLLSEARSRSRTSEPWQVIR